MRHRRYWLAGLIVSLSMGVPMTSASAVQEPSGVITLRALRDQARPVLIFAPGPDDPQLDLQLRTFHEHAPEVQDRQIVPIALPFGAPSSTTVRLSNDEALLARRRFHVAPGEFAVILLGKDGGAKLRSAKPIPMSKLNETIDAMPMRQDEMRGN